MRKAIFIDKDGTLITDVPYNADPGKITLEPKADEAMQLLMENDYALIVVSNQSGIARGYFRESDLKEVADKIEELLGLKFDGFFYCPHAADGNCLCRKPSPGMLLEAAKLLNIDLSRSWMIGDILNDVEAGNRAGCRSLLIDNGNETVWEMNRVRKPVYTAADLLDAAHFIINNQA
jgi:D-glycero-D-manno-heptose 1,7-bisphosphate phosphatase